MEGKDKAIRYLRNARLTPEEEFETLAYLMERYEQQEDPLKLKKKPGLIGLEPTVPEAKKLLVDDKSIQGLSTGYQILDEMTKGINPSEIVVLFADTGIGKSLVAQNITLNIVKRGEPVLFIGLEMTNAENTLRLMQMYGPEKEGFTDLPVLYPETNNLGYKDVGELMEKAKGEGAVLVVVDHLHMFDVGNSNRADGIEDVMKHFKSLTVQHKMPMLLLSHTNRPAGGIGRKVPELRDLKGSSAIEQIADIAITLWKDPDAEDPTKSPLFVAVRKQRKGWRRRTGSLHPIGGGELVEELHLHEVFPGMTLPA